jgi:Uma2 family endonuclease
MSARMRIGDTEARRAESRGYNVSRATITAREPKTVVEAPAEPRTMADLWERLGRIPLERIWLHPAPGTATVDDVVWADEHENRLCELVDGTLVEKPMGAEESNVGWVIGLFIGMYLRQNDLGTCLAADGFLRISTGLVRAPDLSFISWARLPGRKLPKKKVPDLIPDLAVEVISESNTPAEIRRKLDEYFRSGVRLAWVIDPRKRTAKVRKSARRSTLVREHQSLDGGDVLPGFSVKLADLFKDLEAE